MREALAGLTTRGRAFLAAGVTALVCGLLTDQSALSRVGVLAVVLPLLTAGVLGRTRYRLALVRTVSPTMVTAGQPAQVTLALGNEGRTPSGVLLLEDHVPYVLGTRPRFVLEGVGHGWRRRVTYQVRSDVRGHFDIGPMTVRVSDPFGLVELGRAFRSTTPLVVTPRTVPLPTIPVAAGSSASGDNRPRAFASGSAEDVTVREYRRGDELRRVHWRSSARTGELMVRREEQPWQARATVLLDNRLLAHRGQGVASSLEAAVVATASVAVHLGQRGYAVRLVTAAGDDDAGWHQRRPEAGAGALLEALAVVQADSRDRIETGWLGEQHAGGLTVAVLGEVTEADQPLLRRVRHHTDVGLALVLDVDSWSSGAAPPGGSRTAGRSAALLTHGGWRVGRVGPQDRLDRVWEELGRAAASRSMLAHRQPEVARP